MFSLVVVGEQYMQLHSLYLQVEGWTETAIRVFNRHKMTGESEERDQTEENAKMLELNGVLCIRCLVCCIDVIVFVV